MFTDSTNILPNPKQNCFLLSEKSHKINCKNTSLQFLVIHKYAEKAVELINDYTSFRCIYLNDDKFHVYNNADYSIESIKYIKQENFIFNVMLPTNIIDILRTNELSLNIDYERRVFSIYFIMELSLL